ncbi:MAG: MBL fold metallo-hydrolase [Candidatus Methylomirabilales bacterium]
MRAGMWIRSAVSIGILGLFLVAPNPAAAQAAPVKMEWLSWSIFRLTSPAGKVILTNPFVTNPDSPVKAGDIEKADIILVADGHPDEVGSAAEIALKTRATVVTTHELARGFLKAKGLPESQARMGQPGDRFRFDGVTVRLVNAVHGSGNPEPPGYYGGAALGFFITFENGLTVYFSGSTALTMDMQLWGSMYQPDVAILVLSVNRDVEDIAQMARFLAMGNPRLKTVIPHHHRLQPPAGAPTPQDLAREIQALNLPVTVMSPELKKAYTLSP